MPAPTPGTRRIARLSLVALASLLVAGCRGDVGQFVWSDAYNARAPANTRYVIRPGDLLKVSVWNQDSLSGRARVRPDGVISLPLVNDVVAAGEEPSRLAERIQAKLKEFVVDPNVTVAVEEPAAFEVSIVGEVTRPGVYRVEGDATPLKALALAGGLTQLADRDRIFVLRYDDAQVPTRIRFTYRALTQVEGVAAKFRLQQRDVLVVE